MFSVYLYFFIRSYYLLSENGDRYEGEWKNNKKHGIGVYKFSNCDVYEGEFKAGYKHGKGVYRFASGEKYEGEFANNLISGTGKYDYKDGGKYSGEFKANAKHGHGVYTYPDGAVHEGTFVFGEGKGHGKCISLRNARHSAHAYLHIHIHTHNIGKYTFPNGDVYEGPFSAGKMHGSGILTLHSHRTVPTSSKLHQSSSTAFHPPRMEGEFVSGQLISTKAPRRHPITTTSSSQQATTAPTKLPPIATPSSNGKSTDSPNPAIHSLSPIDEHEHPGYVGPLDENGLKHGRGIFIYGNLPYFTYIISSIIYYSITKKYFHLLVLINPLTTIFFLDNGDRYDGEWKHNKKHGTGIYKFAKGDYYEGVFEDGYKHGEGTYRYPNGDIYEGTFVKG